MINLWNRKLYQWSLRHVVMVSKGKRKGGLIMLGNVKTRKEFYYEWYVQGL
mgnify:CR=1 FL=1